MEYSSNAKGNTGVALGATALGLSTLGLSGNNNGCGNGGLLGGLFGGNNDNSCNVSEKELAYSTALASCEAKRYADQIAREESNLIFMEARRQDERIASVVKDTTSALIETGNALAVANTRVECLSVEVARNAREAMTYTDTRVNAEAQLRKCADDNVVAWTKEQLNKKIDGVLKLDADIICGNSNSCNY